MPDTGEWVARDNLGHLSTEKMLDDLIASLNDIKVCELALSNDITEYQGEEGVYSVEERMRLNRAVIFTIDDEFRRREIALPTWVEIEVEKIRKEEI